MLTDSFVTLLNTSLCDGVLRIKWISAIPLHLIDSVRAFGEGVNIKGFSIVVYATKYKKKKNQSGINPAKAKSKSKSPQSM